MSNSADHSHLSVDKNMDSPGATPMAVTIKAAPQAAAASDITAENQYGPLAAGASAAPGPTVSAGMDAPRSVPVRYGRKQIQHLARTGATLGEIAALLGTTVKKLSPRNRRDFRHGRALLQQALRRQQLTLAAVKDPDLRLIFMLGKEYLKQGRDKPAAAGVREPEKTYLNVRMHEV